MNHNQLLAAYFTPAVGIVANNNLLRQHFSKAVMAIKVKIDTPHRPEGKYGSSLASQTLFYAQGLID